MPSRRNGPVSSNVRRRRQAVLDSFPRRRSDMFGTQLHQVAINISSLLAIALFCGSSFAQACIKTEVVCSCPRTGGEGSTFAGCAATAGDCGIGCRAVQTGGICAGHTKGNCNVGPPSPPLPDVPTVHYLPVEQSDQRLNSAINGGRHEVHKVVAPLPSPSLACVRISVKPGNAPLRQVLLRVSNANGPHVSKQAWCPNGQCQELGWFSAAPQNEWRTATERTIRVRLGNESREWARVAELFLVFDSGNTPPASVSLLPVEGCREWESADR